MKKLRLETSPSHFDESKVKLRNIKTKVKKKFIRANYLFALNAKNLGQTRPANINVQDSYLTINKEAKKVKLSQKEFRVSKINLFFLRFEMGGQGICQLTSYRAFADTSFAGHY